MPGRPGWALLISGTVAHQRESHSSIKKWHFQPRHQTLGGLPPGAETWLQPAALILFGFVTVSDFHHLLSDDGWCSYASEVVDSERDFSRHLTALFWCRGTFCQSQRLLRWRWRTPQYRATISYCHSKDINWFQVSREGRKAWTGCLKSFQNCTGMHTFIFGSFGKAGWNYAKHTGWDFVSAGVVLSACLA